MFVNFTQSDRFALIHCCPMVTGWRSQQFFCHSRQNLWTKATFPVHVGQQSRLITWNTDNLLAEPLLDVGGGGNKKGVWAEWLVLVTFPQNDMCRKCNYCDDLRAAIKPRDIKWMTRHAVDHKTNATRPPSEDKHRVLTTHSTTFSVTEWYGENIRNLML